MKANHDLDRLPHQQDALIAATQASEAVAELLRYTREGPNWPAPFGDMEVTCKLAEALKLAAQIELEGIESTALLHEQRDELGQIISACARYIDGWAG
jgi:hypothetical protein